MCKWKCNPCRKCKFYSMEMMHSGVLHSRGIMPLEEEKKPLDRIDWILISIIPLLFLSATIMGGL